MLETQKAHPSTRVHITLWNVPTHLHILALPTLNNPW